MPTKRELQRAKELRAQLAKDQDEGKVERDKRDRRVRLEVKS